MHSINDDYVDCVNDDNDWMSS